MYAEIFPDEKDICNSWNLVKIGEGVVIKIGSGLGIKMKRTLNHVGSWETLTGESVLSTIACVLALSVVRS